MGGSTMKTAKVWRYFEQLPSEEQAAECKICCKKIKATNSSTTGMIRHLRSCHANEYQILQEARQNGIVSKQEEKTRNIDAKQFMDVAKNKPRELKSHSIASIISGNTNEENCPLSKKARLSDCVAVDLTTKNVTKKEKTKSKETGIDKNFILKENFWPDDHPVAKRISNQVGLMLLLDNETPAAVDRAGFRSLLRLLEPKYRMPSSEKFQKTIIPEIFCQLKADLLGLQTNILQNFQAGVEASNLIKKAETRCAENNQNEFCENINTTEMQQNLSEVDRIIMNSIRSAQNISQSFSHSIQLCDDESDLNTIELDSASRAQLETIVDTVGRIRFSKDEAMDVILRCFSLYRYLKTNIEHVASIWPAGVPVLSSIDFAKFIEFAQSNLPLIETLSKNCQVPSFKPFTLQETQFLNDLSAHFRKI